MTESLIFKILSIGVVIFYIVALLVWYRWKAKRIEKEFEDSRKTAIRKTKVH